MRILNLGCGTRTCASPDVVNIDKSLYLTLKRNVLLRTIARPLLTPSRRAKLESLSANVVPHDVAKGIPFPDDSVDAVYHSHVLEHLDREVAPVFLREVKRVLRPGGIQRIVLPDFEALCTGYLRHVAACDADPGQIAQHEGFVARIIEQSVRREGYGAARQTPLRRWFDNLLMGDARKRGETHQWMYDRFTIVHLLENEGFHNVELQRYDKSRIPGWNGYGLDLLDGAEHKPGSLYVEAEK
jgi:SAM-dependent methyltransferase